ncbi:MAG: LuxR C-terminal-related transcriptional regulator [Acidimicrobiales bacterium]|nr:LuxR C-terminal-related transcriptional regulator [Acidimicrobiales bacterium]
MDLLICSDSNLFIESLVALLAADGHRVVVSVHSLDVLAQALGVNTVDGCIIDVSDSLAPVDELRAALDRCEAMPIVIARVEWATSVVLRWASEARVDHVMTHASGRAELLRALQTHRRRRGPVNLIAPEPLGLTRLSAREQQVLAMLSSGVATDAIAADLGIQSSTVRSHLRSIYSKLGVRSRVAAVVLAESVGLGGESPAL